MININEITTNFFLVGCSIRHIEISNDLVFLNGNEKIQLEIGVKPVYQGVKNNKHSGTIKMRIDMPNEKMILNKKQVFVQRLKEFSVLLKRWKKDSLCRWSR